MTGYSGERIETVTNHSRMPCFIQELPLKPEYHWLSLNKVNTILLIFYQSLIEKKSSLVMDHVTGRAKLLRYTL